MRVRFPGEGERGFQLPKGERGDSWLSGERGIVSSPGGVERSDPLALWERVRVRVSHQGYAKVSQGASESEGLSAPQRGEEGFLALRRARDCQLPKGERGDSWLFGERGIVSSPKGRGGILGSPESEGLSAPQRGEGGFLALRRARDCQLPGGGGEVRSPRPLGEG